MNMKSFYFSTTEKKGALLIWHMALYGIQFSSLWQETMLVMEIHVHVVWLGILNKLVPFCGNIRDFDQIE